MPHRRLSPRRPPVLNTAVVIGLVDRNHGNRHGASAGGSRLASYQRVNGVSGNLTSMGSDTLNNLMTLWAEGFRAVYPNVNIQIEGKGSPRLSGTHRRHGATRADEPRHEAFRTRCL